MKRITLVLLVLFVCAAAGAAQDRNATFDLSAPVIPHAPIAHSFKLTGLELARGTFESVADKRWGNMYLIAGNDGPVVGQLTISVDFVSGNVDPKHGNLATRATWTLALFENGQYTGNIYGELIAGGLTWEMDRSGLLNRGLLNAKLQVVGGTGNYATVSPGSAELDADTNYTSPSNITTAAFKITF